MHLLVLNACHVEEPVTGATAEVYLQAVVWHSYHAAVCLYGAEGIVGRLGLAILAQRVEQCGLRHAQGGLGTAKTASSLCQLWFNPDSVTHSAVSSHLAYVW